MVAYALQKLIGWPDFNPAPKVQNHPGTIQLQRLAARISINRVIAGVHFPVDAVAGQRMGQALGEYFVMRSGLCGCTSWGPAVFPNPVQEDPDVISGVQPTDFDLQPAVPGPGHTMERQNCAAVLRGIATLAAKEWLAPAI